MMWNRPVGDRPVQADWESKASWWGAFFSGAGYIYVRESPVRQRKRIRIENFDYAMVGVYFVTMNTKGWLRLFGEILDGKMILNEMGAMVSETWKKLPEFYPGMECDEFIVMPDHIHGIITLTGAPDSVPPAPAGSGPRPDPSRIAILRSAISQSAPRIPGIVRGFKSMSARGINKIRGVEGVPVWHRSYHERILRSGEALERVREYIRNNPKKA